MFIDSLQIGITNHCNSRCRHCGQFASEGYGHPGQLGPPPFQKGVKGYMDLSLYRKILCDITSHEIRFNVFNFFWFGEQLMHPQFRDFIDTTFDSFLGFPFFNHFWIYTNGILLNGKTLDRIVHTAREFPTVFTRIYFSMDAGCSEDYEKIKRQSSYDVVVNNVTELIKQRKALGISAPNIVLGFIVLPENIGSAAKFRDFWTETFQNEGLPIQVCMDSPAPSGDCLYYRVAYLPEQEKYENLYQKTCVELGLLKEENKKESQIIRKTSMELIDAQTLKPVLDTRKACPAPFRCLTINWDGRLCSCCSDYEFENFLPTLADTSVKDAWLSDQYMKIRKAHLLGDFTGYPRCDHCGGMDSLELSEGEVTVFGSEFLEQWEKYQERIDTTRADL